MTDHYVTVNPVSGVRIRSLLLLGLVHRRAAASAASIADFRRHRNNETFAVRLGIRRVPRRPVGGGRSQALCYSCDTL